MSTECSCAACLTFRQKIKTGIATKAIKPDGACACGICCALRRHPGFAVRFGFPSADQPRPKVQAKPRPHAAPQGLWFRELPDLACMLLTGRLAPQEVCDW